MSNESIIMSMIVNATGPVSDFASWRGAFYINYMLFGGLALFINLSILGTLIHQKNLLMKWPTVAGLAFGNLASALHSFVYGVYRTILIHVGLIDIPLNSWICMATMMPTCHVLAYAVAPVIQCLVGVERIVAMGAFNWYRINWTPAKTWRVMIVVLLITVTVSATPLWYKELSRNLTVTMECSSPRIIGVDYLFIEIRFAICVGVLATFFSIGSAIYGWCRMKHKRAEIASCEQLAQFKRQLKISTSFMVVAIFDMILVTVPSVLTVVQLSFPMPDSAKISLYSLSYCVYSTINIVTCTAMNTALRAAFMKTVNIITCKLCLCSSNTVSTLAIGATTTVSSPRKAKTVEISVRRLQTD